MRDPFKVFADPNSINLPHRSSAEHYQIAVDATGERLRPLQSSASATAGVPHTLVTCAMCARAQFNMVKLIPAKEHSEMYGQCEQASARIYSGARMLSGVLRPGVLRRPRAVMG